MHRTPIVVEKFHKQKGIEEVPVLNGMFRAAVLIVKILGASLLIYRKAERSLKTLMESGFKPKMSKIAYIVNQDVS